MLPGSSGPVRAKVLEREGGPKVTCSDPREYALLLGNATTVAKVGFFLEAHRKRLTVSDAHLACLRHHRPRQPHYFEKRDSGKARLVAGWNLVVPESVMDQAWEEPS